MRLTIPTFLALISITAPAYAAPTQQQLCESAIELASAKYIRCRLNAESWYAKRLDPAKRTTALARCSEKLATAFSKATGKYGASCAATEPSASFDDYLKQCSDDVAAAAGGSSLPDYPAEIVACEAELAAAQACGNGVKEGAEECDTADLGGATCAGAGFAGGTLRCGTSTCTLDASGCYATRFVNNGDGTVTDNQTGLQWEAKTTVVDSGQNYADPHDVDNSYTWGSTTAPYPPNGTAFTDFIARLNGSADGVCFTGKCDWRLPTIGELQGIADPEAPGCASGAPCINGIFGPTVTGVYWSSSTWASSPLYALAVSFSLPGEYSEVGSKDEPNFHVRAVRGGS